MTTRLFDDAQWIWTTTRLIANSYAFARRAFRLPTAPARATILITAETRYRLYVNGRFVARGPARGYPEHQPYDEVDLAQYLRKGPNVIACAVHYWGCDSFQNISTNAAGLLVAGKVHCRGGRTVDVSTNDQWRITEARCYRPAAGRLSTQMGYQEDFDAAAWPEGWTETSFDDTSWPRPAFRFAVGLPPWYDLEPAGLPAQREQGQGFARIVGLSTGDSAPRYAEEPNIALTIFREKRRAASPADSPVRHPAAMLNPDDEPAVIAPAGPGRFTAVLLDAGQETTAFLRLDLTACGGEIVDALYCEHVDRCGDVILIDPVTAASRMSVADRYRCRPGRQRHEFAYWKGFRYVLLVFRDLRRAVRVHHVGMSFTTYPAAELGQFECSDPTLNEIWKVGRHTLQLCMHDAYMDCPWREQAQWMGDARVQGLVTFYTSGDGRLMRRMLRLGAQSQTPTGLTYGVFPSRQYHCILPDFSLQWISAHWDYYWYTGDATIFAENFTAIRRLLDWFDTATRPGVLPGQPPEGLWLFLDWSTLYKGDLNATYAMQYLEALRCAAKIARILQQPTDVRRWENLARRLEQAIVRTFWDSAGKVFREGYDRGKGRPVAQVGQHANSLAVLLGLKAPHARGLVEKVLWPIARDQQYGTLDATADSYSPKARRPVASPYFYSFVLQAMFKERFDRQAVETIAHLWGGMIRDGYTTFYESWSHPRNQGHSSACHAWSASPTALLSAYIAGIRPDAAGFERLVLDPRRAGLSWASATVPTPSGLISCRWRRDRAGNMRVEVELPKPVTVRIGPHRRAAKLPAGHHAFQLPG